MSEILVDYFSTIADGIGGEIAKLKSLKDFKDHPRVLRIQQQSVNTQVIRLNNHIILV